MALDPERETDENRIAGLTKPGREVDKVGGALVHDPVSYLRIIPFAPEFQRGGPGNRQR